MTIFLVLYSSFVDLLYLSPQRVKLKMNMDNSPTHYLDHNESGHLYRHLLCVEKCVSIGL